MKNFIVVIFSVFILTSCGDSQKVKDLQARIDALETKVTTLESSVADLQFSNTLRQYNKMAYLTPGSDGYNTIETTLGVLTVSLENIKPYANGSKITLNFGNVTSATLSDVKATLEWGAVDDKGLPVAEGVHARDVAFKKPFTQGAWTKAEVVLEGVPPVELGYVRVKNVTQGGIVLKVY